MKSIVTIALLVCACASPQDRATEDATSEPTSAPEAAPAEPGDPVGVAPDVYQVLQENERVRMLLATWAPGQRDAWHRRPRLVAYALTEVKGKEHLPGGETKTWELPARAVTFKSSAKSMMFENTGSAEAKLLIVELKPGAAAAKPSKGADAVTASSDIYEVKLDVDEARVLLATFKRDQKDAPHAHPAHAVYYLTAFKGREIGADGKPKDVEVAADTGALLDVIETHRLENKGDEARLLLFELK